MFFTGTPGRLGCAEWGDPWYLDVMGTREKKPVTFRCEYCSQIVTEPHGPGQLPRYCAECYKAAQRSLNRQRVRAHRRRKDGTNNTP